MECKHCDGAGFYGNGASQFKCVYCNGIGEVQTNEEWLRNADTEQLAEWIAHQSLIALLENQNNHSLRMTYPAYWVEWLKQPHTTIKE